MSPPAVRLSLVWFLFLGGMGIFVPYYADHLSNGLGLPEGRVGMVLAMIPLAGMAGQLLCGELSDRTGTRRQTIAVLSIVSGGGFLVLGTLEGYVPLLIGTAVLSFHTGAVVPILTATTMASVDADGQRSFSRIRLWGTVGFLVGAVGTPYLFADALFTTLCIVMLMTAATTMALPPAGDVSLRSAPGTTRRLLGHLPVRRVLHYSFWAYVVLQGPLVHLPLLLRDRGGTETAIAWTWFGMLVIEAPLVLFAGRLLGAFGMRGLIAVGMTVEGARWLVVGLTDDLLVLQAVQLVHGIMVVGVVLGVPFYLEACVPRAMRSTGQSIASVAGVGLGGMVSSAAFGHAIERFGMAPPLLVCGVLGLLLAASTALFLPPPRQPADVTARVLAGDEA